MENKKNNLTEDEAEKIISPYLNDLLRTYTEAWDDGVEKAEDAEDIEDALEAIEEAEQDVIDKTKELQEAYQGSAWYESAVD
jgi:hypothetical protein